jgi:hypothetical protein
MELGELTTRKHILLGCSMDGKMEKIEIRLAPPGPTAFYMSFGA